MAEEILLTPELNRDFLVRGAKNEKVIAKLTLYAHDDFVKAYPETHCDVVLVLDTSGSMNEPFADTASITKRQAVAQAVETMLPVLNAADTLTIICYDSAAYVELDHAPGSDLKRIRAAVQKVFQHNGGTNFEKAFATAKAILPNGRNTSRKVIFLTDGNSTEGSLATARKHNQDLTGLGATVDCLGVGSDFNFNEMQKFSVASNGRTVLLGSPMEAGKIFPELLQGAQRSLLNHCTLRLALPVGCRDVEIYQLTPEIRYYDDLKPANDGSVGYRINLQSMMQTHNYIYLVHVGVDLPSDSKTANYPLLKVRLDYDVPVKGLKGQVLENTVAINLADRPDREIQNTQVESDYVEASLEKLDQQVNQLAAASDWRAVAILLHDMKNKAAKLGDDEKASQYQRRIDALKANGHLTQEDLNQIGKSSTRSTRLAGGERPARPDDVDY
jgi:uncharacterized protein YegL